MSFIEVTSVRRNGLRSKVYINPEYISRVSASLEEDYTIIDIHHHQYATGCEEPLDR